MSMNETERRQALATFLRTRREKLTPSEVGLPAGFRRRTAGLRREEVAQLANVGVAWYTSLEQARDVNPSRSVLNNIAEALLLSVDERRHLFLLADQPLPVNPPPFEEQITQALQNIVEALGNTPAYVLGRRWDLLTWNKAAELVFGFSQIRPPHNRNLIWYIFTHPERKQLYLDWDTIAQNVVGQFRADSARYPGDNWFISLINDLQEASPEFKSLWLEYTVRCKIDGIKMIGHPVAGVLALEHTTLEVAGQTDLKVMIYTPSREGETATKLQQLLSTPVVSKV